jgi:hypothetical protein
VSAPVAGSAKDEKDLAQDKLGEASARFPLGLYAHYKGPKYLVFALSLDEETLEPLVHYESLAHGTIWTRTLKNFTETVELPEGPTLRFRCLQPARTKRGTIGSGAEVRILWSTIAVLSLLLSCIAVLAWLHFLPAVLAGLGGLIAGGIAMKLVDRAKLGRPARKVASTTFSPEEIPTRKDSLRPHELGTKDR